MKWYWRIQPSVPRPTFDAAQSAHVAQVADLKADLAAERRRYADLVAELIELKREGFVRPTTQPPPVALPTLPPEVEQAIVEVAGSGPSPLRTTLIGYALSHQHLAPSSLAANIRRGG